MEVEDDEDGGDDDEEEGRQSLGEARAQEEITEQRCNLIDIPHTFDKNGCIVLTDLESILPKRGVPNESDMLRGTINVMGRMIMTNSSQFGRMVNRVESLERSLKRKREQLIAQNRGNGDVSNQLDTEEDDSSVEQPLIKQKIILDDTIECNQCEETLPLSLFDHVTSRKRDCHNNLIIYQSMRRTCKECNKANRRKRRKKDK